MSGPPCRYMCTNCIELLIILGGTMKMNGIFRVERDAFPRSLFPNMSKF